MKNKPKIIKMVISFLIIIIAIILLARYLINDDFRNTVDTMIFKKEITENTSSVIEINSESNPSIYAFDKYITVFSKNVLSFYNQNANFVSSADVNITTPYIASKGKYLAIAENGGKNLYVIYDTNIKWEKELDGDIYRVSVNENGYISVILKNTIYKSIIVVYDQDGNELFKTFLKTSYAICSEISENNDYLAIGQIDYSGTTIKSIVNLISIDIAKNNPEDSKDSIINTCESESNKILNNIKFNNKNEAICMFDSYIQKFSDTASEKMYDINENSIFADINLDNNIVIVEKETSGLFSYNYQVNIKNTVGKSDSLYLLDSDIPKKIKVAGNLVCIHLANEVKVINSSGWLLKHYTTNTEIQEIIVGENVIGIVYNDKVEVVGI